MSGKKKAKNKKKPGKSFNCDQCEKVTIQIDSILLWWVNGLMSCEKSANICESSRQIQLY